MEKNIYESLPVIFSNLQKASEKQQNYDSAEHFGQLSEKHYQDASSGDLRTIKEMIVSDISAMASIQSIAGFMLPQSEPARALIKELESS